MRSGTKQGICFRLIKQAEHCMKHLKQLHVPHNVEKWLLTYYASLVVPEEHKYNANDMDADYNAYHYYGYGAGHADSIKEMKDQLEQQKEEIEKLKELIVA
eukprot:121595_1